MPLVVGVTDQECLAVPAPQRSADLVLSKLRGRFHEHSGKA